MRYFSIAAGAALFLGTIGAAGAATIADFVNDFSTTTNTPGDWSYGAIASFGGALTLFPNHYQDVSRDDWNPGGRTPLVGRLNPGFGTPAGLLHPGSGGIYADARYIVPADVVAEISVSFAIGDPSTTTDGHVLLNGVSLFDTPIDAAHPASAFLTTISLHTGDILDFIAGDGGNGVQFDTTLFSATLSEGVLPEPGTLAVLIMGLGGMGFARCRKART